MSTISPKVLAAAVGAGVGSAVSTLILWVIGVVAYGADGSAAGVNDAVAAVPSPIVGIIYAVLAVVGAAIPGYQTTDPARSNPSEVSEDGYVDAGQAADASDYADDSE